MTASAIRTVDGDQRPHWVYVHLGYDDQPLYVGCTVDRCARLIGHKNTSPWWPDLADVVHLGPFPKRHARGIEAELIRELQPPCNNKLTKRDALSTANRVQVREAPALRLRIGAGRLHYARPFGMNSEVVTGCGLVRARSNFVYESNEPITCTSCWRSLTKATTRGVVA